MVSAGGDAPSKCSVDRLKDPVIQRQIWGKGGWSRDYYVRKPTPGSRVLKALVKRVGGKGTWEVAIGDGKDFSQIEKDAVEGGAGSKKRLGQEKEGNGKTNVLCLSEGKKTMAHVKMPVKAIKVLLISCFLRGGGAQKRYERGFSYEASSTQKRL